MENKLLVLLVAVIAVNRVLSMEPTISLRCKGQNEYLNQDGKCRVCEKCPAGKQPSGYCGHGEREVGYGCEICSDGTYSTQNDYNVCVVCRPCEDWNSAVVVKCEPKYDRVCGRCLEGYFRRRKSDGKPDDECHPCGSAPKDTPECLEEVDKCPWKLVAIFALAGFAALLLIVVVAVCCKWRRKKRKKPTKRDKLPAEESLIDTEPSENFLSSSLTASLGQNSRSDTEQATDGDSGHSSRVSMTSPASEKSVLMTCVSEGCEMKASATRNTPPFQPRSVVSADNYSNMPTAEFRESLPSNNIGQSCMPTRQFDEAVPGPNLANVSSHSSTDSRTQSSRRHNRPQMVRSGSNENLLANVDRDSKNVAGHPAPLYEFHADSFDTRSCNSEVTKPHVVGPNS